MGLDNGSGQIYLFWSGVGADLGELAIVGGLLSIYRRHTCHVHRCWRMARHNVTGTGYVVCRRHHPVLDGPVTADHVASEAATTR